MIISASRRTDIPACYPKWLINRLRAGFVIVPNPVNLNQLSKISLKPEDVECLVLQTKNALPLMPYIDEISERYNFYFQYCVTSFARDIEPGIPSKDNVIIPNMIELAKKFGPERVVWRFAPLMFAEDYTPEYHLNTFSYFASLLSGHIKRVTVALGVFTNRCLSGLKGSGIITDPLKQKELWEEFKPKLARKAKHNGLEVVFCATEGNPGCIDASLIASLVPGFDVLAAGRDRGQRTDCQCCRSNDIGMQDTCTMGCRYCFASGRKTRFAHNEDSPLLFGTLEDFPKGVVTERKVEMFSGPKALKRN